MPQRACSHDYERPGGVPIVVSVAVAVEVGSVGSYAGSQTGPAKGARENYYLNEAAEAYKKRVHSGRDDFSRAVLELENRGVSLEGVLRRLVGVLLTVIGKPAIDAGSVPVVEARDPIVKQDQGPSSTLATVRPCRDHARTSR